MNLIIIAIYLFMIYITNVQSTNFVNHSQTGRNLPKSSFDGLPILRLYISLPEEITPGNLVLDLSKNVNLNQFLMNQNNFPGQLDLFRFSLLNAFDGYLFRIGAKTGHLTVAARLDREHLCLSKKAQFCCGTHTITPPGNLFVADNHWANHLANNNNNNQRNKLDLGKNQQCYLLVHISMQPDTNVDNYSKIINENNGRAILIYLYIKLDDINDHTPQFSTSSLSLNIMEDTPVGSVLHYFKILDPDVGENALINVELSVNALPFVQTPNQMHLAINRPIDNEQRTDLDMDHLKQPFELRVTRDGVSFNLKYELDRETIPVYEVTLLAIDGNKEKPRSSQLIFRVHITDVNDNAPKWVKQKLPENAQNYLNYETQISMESEDDVPLFKVSVPEDTQVGALIYWLQAEDKDIGENARLQYTIDTSAPGGLVGMDYFSIQINTGEVRLRSQLDYELISAQMNGAEIDVPIIVHDNPRSGRQLSARAVLIIKVLDVNDMHPIIVASPLTSFLLGKNMYHNAQRTGNQDVSLFGIWENQPAGQPIASIHVSDPDSGDGGKVTCTISNEYFHLVPENSKSDFDAKLMDTLVVGSKNYQLISAQKLDRELIDRHQVLLTCRDQDANRPLMFTHHLDVQVLDENDNPPVFSVSTFHLNCPENSPPGRIIGRLNASDADLGENAQLVYWINDTDSNWISVHSSTGEIRINTVFDRELEPQRKFTIFVVDSKQAKTAHTASAEVIVEILDENDHTPHFTDLYFFSIPENSSPDTLVGQINAEDEDIGDNGKIQYYLRQSSKEFDLDKQTGKITVKSNYVEPALGRTINLLDREKQDTYELTVYAEDYGNPPRRTQTNVHISLIDVNDHAPEFRYPTPHGPGSLLNISCTQLGSQIIAHVHANDSDTGRNGDIEYSIVRKSNDNNNNNNNNSNNSSINTNKNNSKRFKRESSNLQTNQSTTEPNHINNTSLLNTNGDGQTALTTSIHNESDLTRFHSKPNLVETTLLAGPSEEHFDIDSYSGQLFLIHPIIDCTQSTNVRLVIKATDGGQPPKSSTAVLTVHIYPGNTNLFADNKFKLGDLHTKPDFAKYSANLNRFKWLDFKTRSFNYRNDKSKINGAITSGIGQKQFSMNYHWSAILGLIVAMTVLILLLCLMLIVLRRKFQIDNGKIPTKSDSKLNMNDEKYRAIGMTLRQGETMQDIYGKSSQVGTQSIHDQLINKSQSQSTFSGRTDDFACSAPMGINQLLIEPHHQVMMSNQFYRQIPNSNTAMTLNSGEIALIHHDPNSIQNRTHTFNSDQLIYKIQNGELYGYVDPQSRKNKFILPGNNTYQTLQHKKQISYIPKSNSRHLITAESFTSDYPNNNNEYETSQNNMNNNCDLFNLNANNSCQLKVGNHYTPLVEIGNELKNSFKLCQASQPNLLNMGNVEESDTNYNSHKTVCKDLCAQSNNNNNNNNNRALSLTDLTQQKTELLPKSFEQKSIDRSGDSNQTLPNRLCQQKKQSSFIITQSQMKLQEKQQKKQKETTKQLTTFSQRNNNNNNNNSNNNNNNNDFDKLPNAYCTVSFV